MSIKDNGLPNIWHFNGDRTHLNECCAFMDCFTHDVLYPIVTYEPARRLYALIDIDDRSECTPIRYCPWCQTELPKSLEKELVQALRDIGKTFDEETFIEDLSIPSEYKTEEWWKKRGL